jgi:hypothetical protein
LAVSSSWAASWTLPLAAVVSEVLVDVPLEHPDLTVVDFDQIA